MELAAVAGLELDSVQAAVLAGSLRERADGKWAAFEVAVVGPRQSTGKGALLEARELAGLFLFGEELILHSAHEFKTAQEGFQRLLFRVQDTPELDAKVARVRTSHGEEGIEVFGPGKRRLRCRFVARSTGSGRGFTGDTVIFDEAYNLSDKAVSAMLPTMAARSVTGNPQLWYPSSAPLPDPCSDVLRRICRRGRSGDAGRLFYVEFSADHDPKHPELVDLDDRALWAQANPSMGDRVSEEFIENERAAMDAESFARERLGVYFDNPDETFGWEVVGQDDWEQMGRETFDLVDPVTLGFEVTPDEKHAALVAAGATGDGDGFDLILHGSPNKVAEKCVQVFAGHEVRAVVVDPGSPAGAFIELLEGGGVRVLQIKLGELKHAFGQFTAGCRDLEFRHLCQPELTDSVGRARKRKAGEASLWDRYGGDITAVVAANLAVWGHRKPVEDTEMALPEVVLL